MSIVSGLVGLAPPDVRFAIGTGLGTVVWALDARHRRIARDNVRIAYRDSLSSQEVGRLVRDSMRHFGRLAIETLAFQRRVREAADAQVRTEGMERMYGALACNRGVIAFTGHLGHWELLPLVAGRLGLALTALARPLDNPLLEARLARVRTLSGSRVINKRGAFPDALAVLQQGGLLGIVIDQRPKRGGIPVPFFGALAHTTEGLARLALSSEAVVLPCFAVRERDRSYRLVIEPEVAVHRTGDFAADSYRLTADCTAVLERWVRRYPDQWFWMHRRWAPPTNPPARPQGS